MVAVEELTNGIDRLSQFGILNIYPLQKLVEFKI